MKTLETVQTHGWAKSRAHVLLVGGVLHLLDDANKMAAEPLPYTHFHNEAVSQAVLQSLQVEWMAWQKLKQTLALYGSGSSLPQSLCQLPFLMTPECKKVIMQGEAMLMQNHEVQNSLERAMAVMQRGAVRSCPPPSLSGMPRCMVSAGSSVGCAPEHAAGAPDAWLAWTAMRGENILRNGS